MTQLCSIFKKIHSTRTTYKIINKTNPDSFQFVGIKTENVYESKAVVLKGDVYFFGSFHDRVNKIPKVRKYSTDSKTMI